MKQHSGAILWHTQNKGHAYLNVLGVKLSCKWKRGKIEGLFYRGYVDAEQKRDKLISTFKLPLITSFHAIFARH